MQVRGGPSLFAAAEKAGGDRENVLEHREFGAHEQSRRARACNSNEPAAEPLRLAAGKPV